jgi:hypothetical protein
MTVREGAAFAFLGLLSLSCRQPEWAQIAPAEPRPISGRTAAHPPAALAATDIVPQKATAGVGFDIDFDGTSAVSVGGDGFTTSTTVVFDGHPLTTQVINRRYLIARIPPNLLAAARKVEVVLADDSPPLRRAPALIFEILPPIPPGTCPTIAALKPDKAKAAETFEAQPDGASTLRVVGANFGPKSTVNFGDDSLKTAYRGPALLLAFVPPGLLAHERRVPVTVKDPECRKPKTASASFEISR